MTQIPGTIYHIAIPSSTMIPGRYFNRAQYMAPSNTNTIPIVIPCSITKGITQITYQLYYSCNPNKNTQVLNPKYIYMYH